MSEPALRGVEKPARYAGGEWNAVCKDPAAVRIRVALAFPDVYEIGMSYPGQKILYERANRRADVLAERVYTPLARFRSRPEANGGAAPLPGERTRARRPSMPWAFRCSTS